MKPIKLSGAAFPRCVIAAAFYLLTSGLCTAASAGQQELAFANNSFAFKVMKQIIRDNPGGNVFVSPYSISTVLQMACNGAGGKTKAEMQLVLGTAGLTLDHLNEANLALASSLSPVDTNVILTTVNAIWYQKGFFVKPEFIACNKHFYGATLDALDFRDPHSVDVVNAWAAEKTLGRIRGIADRLLSGDTRLFLGNAVYFKGKWETPFETRLTKDRVFHMRGQRTTKIPMMQQTSSFEYRRGTGYQAVRLPYQGCNLAMYVFLPDVASSPEELLAIMNGDSWRRVTKPGFSKRNGTIVLPRFKLEYGLELTQALESLGMRAAFSAEADFSGISGGQLFISGAKQRTFVEVDEEGTEAAAVIGAPISMGIEQNPPKPFEIIVDRPFLFMIVDGHSGAILFMGGVFEP